MTSNLKKNFDPFIIDNFLNLDDQTAMLDAMQSNIPWTFRPHSVDPNECNNQFPPDSHIFSSYFIQQNTPLGKTSDLANYIILKFIDGTDHTVNYVHRAQGNFDTPTNKGSILRTPHTDVTFFPEEPVPETSKFISLIYYVNNADGNTVIFDKKTDQFTQLEELPKVLMEVTPKQGQLLVFDSTHYHCNWTPVESDYRIVINIILKLDNINE
jgi:hypothetical protein